MTAEQWAVIEQLLACGWSSPKWDQWKADTYRLVLDGYDGDQVLLGVQRLIQQGREFRPNISQVVDALHADPDLPTRAEAVAAIKGIQYVTNLAAAGLPAPSREPAHEAIELFAAALGSRLLTLPLADSDWGHVELRRLGDEWDQFVKRYLERKREGRALEALGRSRRGELGKPPWRALTREATHHAVEPTWTPPNGDAWPPRTTEAGAPTRQSDPGGVPPAAARPGTSRAAEAGERGGARDDRTGPGGEEEQE
jgi:hypothetical protein